MQGFCEKHYFFKFIGNHIVIIVAGWNIHELFYHTGRMPVCAGENVIEAPAAGFFCPGTGASLYSVCFYSAIQEAFASVMTPSSPLAWVRLPALA